MDSDGHLFPDDVPVDFFCKCAECENDIEKLMKYWEQIGVMDSLCLQVHIRSVGWIPMLEAFIRKWGMHSVSADIKRSFVIVEEEQPIFVAQCNERVREVEIIRNHHEWIKNLNHLFPQGSSYHNYWIPRVEAFMQKWSSDYVPADIKSSLAEVKELYPTNR